MYIYFARFLKDNVNFSLNTDDPLIFGNTMNEEFKIAKEYFAMSDQQAAQVVRRIVFIVDEVKDLLKIELLRMLECCGYLLTRAQYYVSAYRQILRL